MNQPDDRRVSIVHSEGDYPSEFPYHPYERYPEYSGPLSAEPNFAYPAVRKCLRLLGYDSGHYGTADWNPLGSIVKPGDHVFIKPNLVTHEYRKSCNQNGNIFSIITHPSVIRPIVDYVAIALKGKGKITIGDNPCVDANFQEILDQTGLDRLAQYACETWNIPCSVHDLRPRITEDLKYYGFKSHTTPQPGDPLGTVTVDLGKKSYFHDVNPMLFRGAFSNRWETIAHHSSGHHRYSFSRSIYDADVFISVPKLKSHHKVGATLNLKGLVGTIAEKNQLVHWRIGFPNIGGDEYPRAHRMSDHGRLILQHLLRDSIPEGPYLAMQGVANKLKLPSLLELKHKDPHEKYRGAWEGNDTCWRMVADLYNILIKDTPAVRARTPRFFSIVDGIWGGDKNGPFCPDMKRAHVVIGGEDLMAVDCVTTRMMDYHIDQIRYLKALMREHHFELNQIIPISEDFQTHDFFKSDESYLAFEPPTGWPHLAIEHQTSACLA